MTSVVHLTHHRLFSGQMLFSRLLVRLVKFLQAKLNGVRLRLAVTWLRMNGVQVGSSVYIGRRVSVRLGRNSTLVIGNNVAIMDDCILVVHSEH